MRPECDDGKSMCDVSLMMDTTVTLGAVTTACAFIVCHVNHPRSGARRVINATLGSTAQDRCHSTPPGVADTTGFASGAFRVATRVFGDTAIYLVIACARHKRLERCKKYCVKSITYNNKLEWRFDTRDGGRPTQPF
jgi:hypothetical protein